MPDWPTIIGSGAANAIVTALIFGFWKPWLGAYGGEKGKNLARKEDLNEILAEVRAVTITQKEIEARLTGDLWNRQTIWVHKRDAYANVIKAAEALARQYGAIASCLRRLETGINQLQKTEELNKALRDSMLLITDFYTVTSIASLFVTPEAESLLDKIINATVSPPTEAPTIEWAMAEGLRISGVVGQILSIAKRDLHLST